MADNNTAVGVNSLTAITTTGADNAAFGVNSLAATTSGTQNVALGSKAGSNITTGGSNVIIGYDSAPTLTTGSSNIVIGEGADVLAANASSYLNIGGVITGTYSPCAVTLANGFTATTQSAGDNSTKLATTAYVDAAASPSSSTFQLITSGTLDTSVSGGLLDFRTPVTNDKYKKLILEITKIVANASSYLLVQFVNQGTANSGANYGVCQGGFTGGTALNVAYTGNYLCGSDVETTTDGSLTVELRGFCNTTTSVLPNISIAGMCYVLGGTAATCAFGATLANIACNNLAGKTFDGLAFINSVGGTTKHTFSWKLYGVT